ncbi:hypothetical protein ANN_10474 [Periplaneta americana]|uniref:Uncharacterized protein n=1 Tax=Periplaneta americana TaxID=6978 RepID=A0ABQ8TRI0_PERAM|nr:hypothetical protein ANN_10474 [Periplaneta americana]
MKSEEPSSTSSSSSSSSTSSSSSSSSLISCAGLNDTCNMMLSTNIPLKKLSDPHFKVFLQKFSRYKNCLSDRRRRFSFENISSFTATLVIASMMTRTEPCKSRAVASWSKASCLLLALRHSLHYTYTNTLKHTLTPVYDITPHGYTSCTAWPAEVECNLKTGHSPAIYPLYAKPVSPKKIDLKVSRKTAQNFIRLPSL